MIVNRGQLAETFGVEPGTVDRWVQKGMPVVDRPGQGRPAQYDTAACIAWHAAREAEKAVERAGAEVSEDELDEWRRRKAKADALLRELELAKAEKLVAPIAQMDLALDKAFSEVTARLETLPARLPRMIVGQTEEAKIRETLTAELREVQAALCADTLVAEADVEHF